MEDLVNILASAVGSLTNPTKLENTFRTVLQSSITDKTIKKYMDYLLDAFLIDTAIRFFSSRRIQKSTGRTSLDKHRGFL